MYKKIISYFQNQSNSNQAIDKIIGAFMFIAIFSAVYMAGLSDGHTSNETVLLQLEQLQAKTDKLQQIIETVHGCNPDARSSGAEH